MLERFTDRARRVLVLAQEEARLLNHTFIGTEHLLLGLVHEAEGTAARALRLLGISLEAVRGQVKVTIGTSPTSCHSSSTCGGDGAAPRRCGWPRSASSTRNSRTSASRSNSIAVVGPTLPGSCAGTGTGGWSPGSPWWP